MSTRTNFLGCPHCCEEVPYGATVCRGCGAEVVYGTTQREASDHHVGSVFIGLILAAVFFTHIWWAYLVLPMLCLRLMARHEYWDGKVRFLRVYRNS